ncbi:hypothetical protein ACQRXC_27110 (plasmid) [Niallia taxi]|uniref:Uncharacterized protein n=1 Tax=Niallia taxi TaxID=2499688 RepID=A0A437K2L1_9BACI|nr:hypothetical protein [Niallia taxi]MDK8643928.1 hypothetical protein [Niallia taxi]MED4057387.1 hypothetical protein [Niallia taxi]RVT56141.1 hypothetical protein EM808_28270 [Niallia taxi]
MKNLIILYSTVIMSLILASGCANNNRADVKEQPEKTTLSTINIDSNFIEYEQESSLYKNADLIVIANTDVAFKDREHIVKYMETDTTDKAIEDFYTRTPINISQVIKKPNEENIIENDKIEVIEPLSVIQTDEGEQKITRESYIEMQEQQEYMLYLKKNSYGEYSIINMNNGIFQVTKDTEDAISLEQQIEDAGLKIEEHTIADHEDISDQIDAKYSEEIEEVMEKNLDS